MPRRRMLAPITAMWGEGQDPNETLAELQRINEGARVEDGQRALNALNGPKRSSIQPGFARGSGNSVYMGAGLDDAVREQQERKNRLLGTALAISHLTGKTEVKTTNALPDTVNNIDPQHQRRGTEGADSGVYEGRMADYQEQDQQKRVNMALSFDRQRKGLDVSRGRPQSVVPMEDQQYTQDDLPAQDALPEGPSGSATDEWGRRVTMAPQGGDEDDRRRHELMNNRAGLGLAPREMLSDEAADAEARRVNIARLAAEAEEQRRRRALFANVRGGSS